MDLLSAVAPLRAAGLSIRRRLGRSWQADPVPVPSVIDIPERMPPRTAVVVRKAGHNRWLVFDCPCGTGHRVMLNLDPTNRPVWTMTGTGTLTLTPSVNQRTATRHCHYTIRRGRVRWV